MSWQDCKHCYGKTKCDCGSCVEFYTNSYNRKRERAGICRVCGGTGGKEVYDPPKYESSSSSGSGSCLILLLMPMIVFVLILIAVKFV